MNHSCDPNTLDQWSETGEDSQMVAAKDIQPGDELTCDYNLSDWDFEGLASFDCWCGAPSCQQRIEGFSRLTQGEQERLLPEQLS